MSPGEGVLPRVPKRNKITRLMYTGWRGFPKEKTHDCR
jgi:hypothetical protein